MRTPTLISTVALAALSSIAVAEPAVLALPYEEVHYGIGVPRPSLPRRDNTLQVSVGGPQVFFTVNVTLGTPPQPVTLVIDTGSSDLVATIKASTICGANPGACGEQGYYNANKSSTYKFVSSNWTGNYGFQGVGSASGGTGDYATDKLVVGKAALDDFFMAIEYQGSLVEGILGVSYPGGESTVGGQNSFEAGAYDNFPQRLVKQGIINTAAFSVYGQRNSFKGTVLFGGIDTKKYTGDLVPNDISEGFSYYTSQIIILNDVQIKGLSSSSNSTTSKRQLVTKKATNGFLVGVDTGSTGCMLPDRIANPIIQALGGTFDSTTRTVKVDCSYLTSTASLDFIFPNITLNIPIGDFIGRYGTNNCLMSLTPGDKARFSIIGVNFLKNVYTVFDLEKNQISFAKRDFTATDSSIVAIGTPKPQPSSISSAGSGTGSRTSSATGSSSTASSTGSPQKNVAAKSSFIGLSQLLIIIGTVVGVSILV